MRESWESWCDQVCGQIRFGPDRDAVREELDGHLEDHCRAIQEDGVEEAEAERLALLSMGDPVEVGKELDAVHQPLLGYLWLISKVAVIALVLVTAVLGLQQGKVTILPADAFQSVSAEYQEDEIPWFFYQEYDLSAEAGGYTFRVEKAGLWPRVNDDSIQELYVGLTVRYPWPWERLDIGAFKEFYLVDDQGNRYDNYYRYVFENEQFCVYESYGLVSGSYLVYVPCVPRDVQWVELRYDRGGRQLTFHIDLTEGGSA